MLIYFAGYREQCRDAPDGVGQQPWLEEELRPYGSGKGAVRFPLDRPLPTDLIRTSFWRELGNRAQTRSNTDRKDVNRQRYFNRRSVLLILIGLAFLVPRNSFYWLNGTTTAGYIPAILVLTICGSMVIPPVGGNRVGGGVLVDGGLAGEGPVGAERGGDDAVRRDRLVGSGSGVVPAICHAVPVSASAGRLRTSPAPAFVVEEG